MRFRWNNSKLMTLERCGEAFRRQHVEMEVRPPNVAMVRGSAVGRVVTEAHKRQMRAKDRHRDLVGSDTELRKVVLADSLPSDEETADLTASEFERSSEGGVVVPKGSGDHHVVVGHSKDVAIRLARHYVKRVAPIIDPVAVERLIEVKPADSNMVIHGQMDLVERIFVPVEGGQRVDQTRQFAWAPSTNTEWQTAEVIRDTKTSERRPRPDMAHKSQQLTFYTMLRSIETKQMPDAVVLDYLVSTPKLGITTHVPLVSVRKVEDVKMLVNRLNVAVDAAEKGVFVPTTPDSWWCSPRWCQWYSTCKYVTPRADDEEEGD